MLKLCMRLAALACFLAMAGNAHAEGFALYEYSARGVALGGSVMARKPDASAVAHNPALMTKLKGVHIMGGVSSVSPRGDMRSKDANGDWETTSLKASTWFIPHFYYTHQLNDKFTLGIGEFSRFGLGFEYPHNWPGRFNIYQVSLKSASINPNIAWAATAKLSLAAGVELVYVTLDLKKRAQYPVTDRATGNIAGVLEADSNIQDADDVGVGFNVAGHYQFNDQWAVGLQYRSQVRVHAYGDAQYSYIGYQGAPSGEPYLRPTYDYVFQDGTAHSTVILPDSIAGGISWTPVPEFSIEVGATWTHWSTFRSLNIHLPEPVGVSENRKHWKDSWRLNAGVEYEPLDWLALRTGYVYDQSPMTESYEDYLVPTADRHIFSLGTGFKWDAWTVDLAYAYILPKDRSYSLDSRQGADGTNVRDSKTRDGRTNIFSVSLGYHF